MPSGLAPSTGNVRLHLQDDYSLIYDNLPIKQIPVFTCLLSPPKKRREKYLRLP